MDDDDHPDLETWPDLDDLKRGDLVTLGRAVKEGWPITPARLAAIADRAFGLATAPGTPARLRLRAIRFLVDLDAAAPAR